MAGDAMMLYNIQFPPALNPYLILQLGESLKSSIADLLEELDIDSHEAIQAFKHSLFPMITPAISRYIGGHRLALLTTDSPSDAILRALPTLSLKLPEWRNHLSPRHYSTLQEQDNIR